MQKKKTGLTEDILWRIICMKSETILAIYFTSLEAMLCACLAVDPSIIKEAEIGNQGGFLGKKINYFFKRTKERADNAWKLYCNKNVGDLNSDDDFDAIMSDYFTLITYGEDIDKEFPKKLYRAIISTLVWTCGMSDCPSDREDIIESRDNIIKAIESTIQTAEGLNP